MRKLSMLIQKLEIESVILNGMGKLVGDEKALEAWNKLDQWTFTINHRATGRLGQCQYRDRNVDISNVLLKPEHINKLRNTTIHEIAHAVNPMLFGRNDGHGHNWRRIMRAFGEMPHRCNTDKDVSEELMKKKKAKAREIWACQRCEKEYPILKRRKHPMTSYRCKCHGSLYVKQCTFGRHHHNPSKQAA